MLWRLSELTACGFRVKGVNLQTPRFGFLVMGFRFRVTIESFFALKLQDVAINRGAFLVAFRMKTDATDCTAALFSGGGWRWGGGGVLNAEVAESKARLFKSSIRGLKSSSYYSIP